MLEAAGDRILLCRDDAVLDWRCTCDRSRNLLREPAGVDLPHDRCLRLLFLAQAAFGAALLRTGLLPGWVGWATIIWNLGWLVVLPLVRPQDMYYPWLHYAAPILIGIVLLSADRPRMDL